jgi:hypothetical protein
MLQRLFFAALFFLAATCAGANTYSDVWYDAAEPGWGVFVKQSNTFQFLAFFVYGPGAGSNAPPTWYTAQLTNNGDGTGLNYTGPLYATTGTYFGAPWQGDIATAVGSATFAGSAVAEDYSHATLTYTVNGVTVTKPIVRQTLTAYALSGSYSGSVAGAVSSCADAANNKSGVNGRFNLTVAQVGDASATLTFNFVDPNTNYNGMVCTLGGALTHNGTLYSIPNAQVACTAPGFSPGSIVSGSVDLLDQTGQGIEGKWSATTTAGCVQVLHFAALLD